MFNGFLSHLASSGPIIHITALPLFKFHGLTITNSMFYGWICALVIIIIMITVAHKVTIKPKRGFIQLVEAVVEFITNLVESSFEDRSKGRKYVPYFVTLFVFLLMNNWLGLVPGVGEAFSYHGNPLLRPFTGDLNATLAAGVITMIMVYSSSIREAGFKKYIKHFFIGSPLNPMYLLLGLIEMLTDFTRVISLSIRLFLNVTIGEIIIAVFSYLGGFLAPLTATPFTLIELFVGALQAYIFVILSLMYLAIAVNHTTAHEDLTDDSVPETISLEPESA
ncbi:MAG TPA: F0F1 ATP synthase subunit A [Candidatus Saccharimonadales bacterium]|nr:F0F1 ATP synthase subunit A [Candidatus Saccharimonadales bacterium]